MDVVSTIMSVALTAAIVVPLVVAVVFIRQLRDIARANSTRGSAEANGRDDSSRSEAADPVDEPDWPDEGHDGPSRC